MTLLARSSLLSPRTTLRSALALVFLSLSASCATVAPPAELLDARAAYDRASHGRAAELKPDGLLSAKQQLDRAENLFSRDADTSEIKDAAYIAVRKSLLVESEANTIAAIRMTSDAENWVKEKQAIDLSATKGKLVSTQAELEKERLARETAERRAAASVADLQKIAAVRRDERGVVITLQGGVLFKTDKSELLPAAMAQLNQVAEALLRNSPDSMISVGGYTDAQGSTPHNQELSERRAKSVGDYLVGRGISKDRVVSKGYGPQTPIADNTSVEGRAQNRRVEIIVENAKTP